VPAGVIGEIIAGTARAGTGGNTLSARTTTAPTSGGVAAISLTLNKGSYIIFATGMCTNPDASTRTCGTWVAVGGTAITNEVYTDTLAGNYWYWNRSIPINITADGTVVAIATRIISLAGAPAGANNEMWAIREA
jgi:hypothetical protein